MRRKNNILKIIFLIFLIGISLNLSKNNSKIDFVDNKMDGVNEILREEDIIKVHFLDVGQGDSIFIELNNDKTMLIDAGEANKGDYIVNYIKDRGYSNIDYLIGTHPHADHIGGLVYIINNFDIGSIYMPKAVSTSKTYENLLNTILENNLKVKTAKAGVNIYQDKDLIIDIIAPNKENYKEINNYSAVIKLKYGNRSFLFMGDAEEESELEIESSVLVDVIKIGHHGSDTSSSLEFVNKVRAKYGIVSVGEGNRYKHPNEKIINRWRNIGTSIYRTDLHGSIIFITDGNIIEIETEK